ncbi:hypothetical protein CFIICLFH_3826 [Methylobacterium goesingense]|nr:hypothetical protein CFIICLFH_3826 [Methylobacterium goesingense]
MFPVVATVMSPDAKLIARTPSAPDVNAPAVTVRAPALLRCSTLIAATPDPVAVVRISPPDWFTVTPPAPNEVAAMPLLVAWIRPAVWLIVTAPLDEALIPVPAVIPAALETTMAPVPLVVALMPVAKLLVIVPVFVTETAVCTPLSRPEVPFVALIALPPVTPTGRVRVAALVTWTVPVPEVLCCALTTLALASVLLLAEKVVFAAVVTTTLPLPP